ncbi:MAG: LUD domain-containing protein [Filomicrobium sp.]
MSRQEILSRIRKSLNASEQDTQRQETAAARIAKPPCATPPDRVAAKSVSLIECFKTELERQLATVKTVSTLDEVPASIADYLRGENQALSLRVGTEPIFSNLDFSAAGLSTQSGPAEAHDGAGLSGAFGAAAETGTMALLSGPENPVTLGFLPDTHIIVIPQSRIKATYEVVFALLRNEKGAGTMPRTLNLISGPSRTADIGGRIVIGAHGPRRLLAIIVSGR